MKPRYVTVFGLLLAACVSACSLPAGAQCNIETLQSVRGIDLQSLRPVKKYADGIDPKSAPYAAPFLVGYYSGTSLKVADVKNSAEYGKSEYRFWILSDSSFVAEERQSWYEKPIDAKAGPHVADRIGNRFLVCNGAIIGVEPLDEFKPFGQPNDEKEELIRTLQDAKKQLGQIKD